MWERARDLLEQADRLHRHFFQLVPTQRRRPTWEPPIDVFETNTELWVLAALPGVEPESIEVQFDGRSVTIAGANVLLGGTLQGGARDAIVHRVEIPHGRFERRLELPVACEALERQELRSGCLFLSLRKRGT